MTVHWAVALKDSDKSLNISKASQKKIKIKSMKTLEINQIDCVRLTFE